MTPEELVDGLVERWESYPIERKGESAAERRIRLIRWMVYRGCAKDLASALRGKAPIGELPKPPPQPSLEAVEAVLREAEKRIE